MHLTTKRREEKVLEINIKTKIRFLIELKRRIIFGQI